MSDWRSLLFTRAWEDPQFFQQLMDHRSDPGGVLDEAGIDLSEEDLEALQRVLAADTLQIEIDWNTVGELVGESISPQGRWPHVRPWINVFWRP